MRDLAFQKVFARAVEEIEGFFRDFRFQRLRRDQFPCGDLLSAWRGSIQCEGSEATIIVGIPYSFPDELPKIYLTKEFKYYPIPHVGDNNLVCTFDTDSIDFFSERVRGLLEETINKARDIISDGISGRNKEHFKEEFLAYWPIGSDPLTIYSILEPIDEVSEIRLCIIESQSAKIQRIAGSTEDTIKEYAEKIDEQARIVKTHKALFLPLKTALTPPFPQNNVEMLSLLKRINPTYEQAVFEFLLQNEYEGTIIFSVPIGKSIVFASWQHVSPEEKLITKGFRPGNVNKALLRTRLSSQKIRRGLVERIDGDRLQQRTGGVLLGGKDRKICIIGCGSLGSHIAFGLVKAGIKELVLVDNDLLLPENVGRHLCGMSDINQEKVYAVKKRIEAHFPHVKIKSYAVVFHQILKENPEELYSSDLIITATGNTAIERRLNQTQYDSEEFPTLLYSWIEPYGIASHAVLVVRGQGGCFNCCLDQETLRYAFSVGQFRETDTSIREAGCQTSFTPYSSLEANQASSIATRLALVYLNGEVSSGMRYSWLGDVGILERMGIEMNKMYSNMPPFSLKKATIEKIAGCSQCG